MVFIDKMFNRWFDLTRGWVVFRIYETCAGDTVSYSWTDTMIPGPKLKCDLYRSIDKDGNDLWILNVKVAIDLAIEEEMEF